MGTVLLVSGLATEEETAMFAGHLPPVAITWVLLQMSAAELSHGLENMGWDESSVTGALEYAAALAESSLGDVRLSVDGVTVTEAAAQLVKLSQLRADLAPSRREIAPERTSGVPMELAEPPAVDTRTELAFWCPWGYHAAR
jgi:hypothetical protein